MEQVIDILESTRELISDESRWTQHCYARNEYDESVSPYHESAVKWSLLGALEKVCHTYLPEDHEEYILNACIWVLMWEVNKTYAELTRFVTSANEYMHGELRYDMKEFNDGFHYSDVLLKLDKTIGLIERRWLSPVA